MIFLYRTLSNIFYPILVLIILFRKFFNKEHTIRYKEKIFSSNFNILRKKDSKLIWFHAASIGEMKSILPIIIELNKKYHNFEFLITTVTLSSGNLIQEEIKTLQNVRHRYFPIDVNFLTKKFLSLWKPDFIFFVDSEIWPNFIQNISRNKIPLAIINARLTAKSIRKWMFFPRTAKSIFGHFDLCLSSNLETKDYLLKLKAKNIFNTGNIKLISSPNINQKNKIHKGILLNKNFWLAASTHKGEELFCLNTHLELKKKHQKIFTVIAPRHINRVNEIKELCDKFNLDSQIIDANSTVVDDKEIIIINAFGVLSEYFKYAKSVFIGKSTIKSLEKSGGQNPIDAAKLGCKIYHGPYVYNFHEIYRLFEANNISREIKDSKDLAKNLMMDFNSGDKNINKFAKLMSMMEEETLDKTMTKINEFLFNKAS